MYQVNGVLVTPPVDWLPLGTDPVTELVIREAHACLGIREAPPASNRGPRIDAWLRQAKVPESVILSGNGFWCAAWAGAMWRNGGGPALPPGYADCDVLRRWAQATGRWSDRPSLAAMVLYGKRLPPDATHLGIVADLTAPVLSIEGNTSVEGGALERNGTAVAMKLIQPSDPVLGYISLRPAAS